MKYELQIIHRWTIELWEAAGSPEGLRKPVSRQHHPDPTPRSWERPFSFLCSSFPGCKLLVITGPHLLKPRGGLREMMRVMCLAEAPQQVSARTILLGAHPPRICIHTILSSKWISPFKTHSNTSFISSSGGGGAPSFSFYNHGNEWRPGNGKRTALGLVRSGRSGSTSHYFRDLHCQVPRPPPHHTPWRWRRGCSTLQLTFLAETKTFEFHPQACPKRRVMISQEMTVK